jgi:hypothetical protein
VNRGLHQSRLPFYTLTVEPDRGMSIAQSTTL